MSHEWLTASEAAAYARCSKATMYILAREGKVRVARITGNKGVRFLKEWIDEWLIRTSKYPRKMAVNQ